MFKNYYISDLLSLKSKNLVSLNSEYRHSEADISYMKVISSIITQALFLSLVLIYIGFNSTDKGVNAEQLSGISGTTQLSASHSKLRHRKQRQSGV